MDWMVLLCDFTAQPVCEASFPFGAIKKKEVKIVCKHREEGGGVIFTNSRSRNTVLKSRTSIWSYGYSMFTRQDVMRSWCCFSRWTAPPSLSLTLLHLPVRGEHSKPDGCSKVSEHRWQSPADLCTSCLSVCTCRYVCVYVCMWIQVCVCVCLKAEGPQSGRKYEHARPAGVNKQLMTLSAGRGKNYREARYLSHHLFSLYLARIVIYGNNVKVWTF